VIELRGLTKIYAQGGQELTALNNVSLLVPAGEMFGVLGQSGAGKSTLIRCVNLLERPTAGQVLVDGKREIKSFVMGGKTKRKACGTITYRSDSKCVMPNARAASI
jgi:ABC-type methionine transport system ATPase subunit